MKKGTALENGLSAGCPDFTGDTYGMTLSPDHTKVKMVNVWKCPKCGHSIGNK